MDKAEQRHDEVLEKLVKRLAKKPGFLSIKENYYDDEGVLRGEMDVHWFRKINGVWHHRYYEVKGRYSDGAEERCERQFEQHKKYWNAENFKYVMYADGFVVRKR